MILQINNLVKLFLVPDCMFESGKKHHGSFILVDEAERLTEAVWLFSDGACEKELRGSGMQVFRLRFGIE